MLSEKTLTKKSKFLSLILRHQPDIIGIKLDEQGWIEVDTLLNAMQAHGEPLTRAGLEQIVAENNKKRFAFDETGTRIRASQGHSVEVSLGYEPQTPPDLLYHGTASGNVQAILAKGIERRSRHQVHLSVDTATALNVGSRHGKPVLLRILAKEMQQAGHLFYCSANGVWLTDFVPAEFISEK